MGIRLVLPNAKYKRSYISAVREFQVEQNPAAGHYLELDIVELEKDFDAYVQLILSRAEGKNLPAGYVPATEYWIINENGIYVGRVDIRHRLNQHLQKEGGNIGHNVVKSQRGKGYGTQALKLGLEKAKELGLQNVLLTCDVGNVPSSKIIEKNGGILEDIYSNGVVQKKRYWISNS